MKTIKHTLLAATLGLVASVTLPSASLVWAQTVTSPTPNGNTAAVDTLTKEVAIAVFANLEGPKAQDIYAQLLECGDGCDAQTIIRTVGGWDAVGVKMEELSILKNTARFAAMPPAEANAAIRKQLSQFYARYKADRNYGEPLSPAVRVRILETIDRMLPPAVTAEPTPATANSAGNESANAEPTAGDESDINPKDYQISRLEREVKEAREKQIWMTIISAIAGLLIGAGAVYWLMVRALKKEVARLTNENGRLSQSLDAAQRNRPANEPRQPQPDYRQKADAYDALRADLGMDPVIAIRRLKQQAGGAVSPGTAPPAPRAGTLQVGGPASEPAPDPLPTASAAQTPSAPVQPVSATPTPARNEVFYVPPPDPNGQFDVTQKADALSPESAYQFTVNADKPDVAIFRFEAEPGRVARFLTYRNYMIEPACDSENSYSSTYTRIVNRRDGEALLENGTWRVKTKALIRYE